MFCILYTVHSPFSIRLSNWIFGYFCFEFPSISFSKASKCPVFYILFFISLLHFVKYICINRCHHFDDYYIISPNIKCDHLPDCPYQETLTLSFVQLIVFINWRLIRLSFSVRADSHLLFQTKKKNFCSLTTYISTNSIWSKVRMPHHFTIIIILRLNHPKMARKTGTTKN